MNDLNEAWECYIKPNPDLSISELEYLVDVILNKANPNNFLDIKNKTTPASNDKEDFYIYYKNQESFIEEYFRFINLIKPDYIKELVDGKINMDYFMSYKNRT